MINKFLIILALLLPMLFTEAQALEVNRSVLKSGLTVLHSERHNLPMVVVKLVARAGSLYEPNDKAGIANLTVRLLNEGTVKRTSRELSSELEYMGAKLGVSMKNDYSGISLTVLKKDLDKGFELFSDVLLNPVFSEQELKRKREHIKGTRKVSEEDPGYLASKAFINEIHGGHSYGRPVDGNPEMLDSITREDIVSFYKSHYLPNNSILAVAGDLDPSELELLLKKYLGAWKRGTAPMPKPLVLKGLEKKTVLIDKDITQANIILGHRGIRRDNPDYYALKVMNYTLGGGGFSSRLMDSIRDKMGLAYGVFSTFPSFRDGGRFYVGVQTKNATAKEVIDEILRQIRLIREQGVTGQELSDAKSFLTGSFPRLLDSMSKIVGFLSILELYGLEPETYREEYIKRINSVSSDDVLRVARKYLDTENYILTVVARQSEANLE